MAEQRRVEIRLYRVIYEIFDDLKKALSGMLEPEIREKLHGHAEIRQVYQGSAASATSPAALSPMGTFSAAARSA